MVLDVHVCQANAQKGGRNHGLMKVAQFLHTTMATAMGVAAMPKPSPIPIITGSIP